MSAGSRKYPYRHYPATPAKSSERNYWFGLFILFVLTVLSVTATSHLLIR